MDKIFYFLQNPIAQDQNYHNFCDNRMLFGISNFMDVISNAPFIVIGIIGFLFIIKNKKTILWKMFFIFLILIGIGSSYYHISPSNETLMWDRLPMALSFMTLFSAIIYEKINKKLGLFLFPFLLFMGVFSVFYWRYTEHIGAGDLRFYAIVQFVPLIILPFIFLFCRKEKRDFYVIFALIFYVLAKFSEMCDCQIYNFCKMILSGHSLKHYLSAISAFKIFIYVKSTHKKSSYSQPCLK
ncbi:MAG: ceramidase domain-containing protein [Alphaproteobacteria bacterium]